MSKYLNLFTDNIRHYAKEMNNNQLSIKSGVSPATISQLMSGKRNPTLEVIVKLAAALRVEPSDLLAETKENKLPADILEMLENLSPTGIETIRTLLNALNQNQKSSKKVGR